MSDIRLYMFEGGTVYLPLRNVNLGQGGNGEMITTPVTWFVLTHPRGNVVFDGGNAAAVAVDAKKHWGVITEMSTPFMTPEQAVLPSLRADRRRPGERALDRPEPPPSRPHRGARRHRPLPERAGARHAHRVRMGSPAGVVQRARLLSGRLRQAGDRLGAARGVGRRLGRVRRRHAALLAHAGPLSGPPVVRGAPAERAGVRPRLRCGEHARPPEREVPAGLHHLRGRHRALGAQAATPRLARGRDRCRESRPGPVAAVRPGARLLRLRRSQARCRTCTSCSARRPRAWRPTSTTAGTTTTSARTSRRRGSSPGSASRSAPPSRRAARRRSRTRHLALYEYEGELARWRADLEERIGNGKIVLPEWFPEIRFGSWECTPIDERVVVPEV